MDIDEKSSYENESVFVIRATICGKCFDWMVLIEKDELDASATTIDVTPSSTGFSILKYDPYSVVNDILSRAPDAHGNYDLKDISSTLVGSLIKSQNKILTSLENSR